MHKMSGYYTGIGSRQTPHDVLVLMGRIAQYLAEIGYTLRSGAAPGADTAFEDHAKQDMEIYLPWIGFAGRPDEPPYFPLERMNFKVLNIAAQITEKYHPGWNHLSTAAAKLHIRNAFQVLGKDLKTPSDFVVCWSPKKGGTTQAIRIAEAHKIPVFNLTSPDALPALRQWLRERKS